MSYFVYINFISKGLSGMVRTVQQITLTVFLLFYRASVDYLITHTNTCTHTHTHTHIYIYILFKRSKIYIKTFKTLLHVSITRSSSRSIYCSLLKL